MRILPTFACGIVLLALLPAGAAGQDRVLTISLAGMNAATVANVEGGNRQTLGTVAPSRSFPLDFSVINSVKGKKYDVALHQTATGNTLLFLGDGERDAACDAARDQQPDQGTGDRCEMIAVVRDGYTSQLGIDAAGGVINVTTRTARPRFTVGLEASYTWFGKLDDVACDIPGLSSCQVDDAGMGFGGFLQYDVLPNISIGARWDRSTYRVDQVNGQVARHDVTLNEYNVFGSVHPFPFGIVRPYFLAGWGVWVNQGDVLLDGSLLENRSQSGGRMFGGAGLDFDLFNSLGGRTSLLYGSGGSDDADTHLRAAFGLTLNF